MNFLAHIFLSGNNEGILVGNFISDYIKGQEYVKYPKEIRKGILLHRRIDSFTDSHPVVRESKTLFYSHYHKYAGVITDILYDHFLATEWSRYSQIDLDVYISNVHEILSDYYNVFPERVQKFYPYFIKHNWLKIYQSLNGIERVFDGMSSQTSLPDETLFAMQTIQNRYDMLRMHFLEYFPQLIAYVESQLKAEAAEELFRNEAS